MTEETEITTSASSWALRVLERLSFSTVSLVLLRYSDGPVNLSLTIFLRFSPWKTFRVSARALDSILFRLGSVLILYSLMGSAFVWKRPEVYSILGVLLALMSSLPWLIARSHNLLVMLFKNT